MFRGITISFDLRPCMVTTDGINHKALFHSFSCYEGNAIVELSDGKCLTVDPEHVQFVDDKISGYAFGDGNALLGSEGSCEYCAKERKPIDWKYCPKCGRDLLTK